MIVHIYDYCHSVILPMDRTSAATLQLLAQRPHTLRELSKALGISYSRSAGIARSLLREGYLERSSETLQLARNAKAELVKTLAGRYNLERLLADAQGRVLQSIREPKREEAIQQETGLSQSATYAALSKLAAVGAIVKRDSKYQLADDEDLASLVSMLAREEAARNAEPFATVLKTSIKGQVLKRASRGVQLKGSLTGFSVFPRFGLEYEAPYDYYVYPPEKASPEAAVVHALASSQSRTDRTICALFVLKNRKILDHEKSRKLAQQWGILDLWLDADRLAEGTLPENPEDFLPWKEYVEKARLYGLPASETRGSDTGLALLRQIGAKLGTPTVAYLFGGGNMLLRGLKPATKDVDLILEDTRTFQRITKTLTTMGFKPLAGRDLETEDRRLEPSGIYVASHYPRVDLFTKTVLGKLQLTEEMKERGEERRLLNLQLKLLSLEDVFLFKSITERVGDLDDMAIIIRKATEFDWPALLKTYWKEEELSRTHFCFTILENLEILQEKEGIRLPIHRALLRHCIDTGIMEAVKRGANTVEEIKKLVEFPEHRLRNRIRALIAARRLVAQPGGKGVKLSIASEAEEFSQLRVRLPSS